MIGSTLSDEVLRLQDLAFAYGADRILSGVDLTLARGERVAVMGRSGVGKSTLLNLLALIQDGFSGEFWFKGLDMRCVPAAGRERLRAEDIGMVFQSHFLVPYLTVRENVALPAAFLREPPPDSRADDLLAAVGLSHRADHFPNQLSGGEQQRVGFARALLKKPALLLADEPTGNLDEDTGAAILALILDQRRWDGAVVTVTHQREVARRFDKVYRLEQGRLSLDVLT